MKNNTLQLNKIEKMIEFLKSRITPKKKYSKNLKNFWNNCDDLYAHIVNNPGGIRQGNDVTLSLFGNNLDFKSFEEYRLRFQEKYELDNMIQFFQQKSVLEYGIGSGLLGKLLLEYCNISNYFGVDIAERQLKIARKNLTSFLEAIELMTPPVDFSSMKTDVFISHACIQHFPTLEYYSNFFENLNNSGIQMLFLQTRYMPQISFNDKDPAQACFTNTNDLMSRLTHYHLVCASDPSQTRSQYQYSRWMINNLPE